MSTITQLQQFSASIITLSVRQIQFNSGMMFIEEEWIPYLKPIKSFLEAAGSFDYDELVSATHSEAPKIRALAICGLWLSWDARAIHTIAGLRQDTAPSFKDWPFFNRINYVGDSNPTTEELLEEAKVLSVGEVANYFLEAAYREVYSDDYPESLDQFLAERKDRSVTGGWLKVRKKIVTAGTSPFPEYRRPIWEELQAFIRNLADPLERDLYTLYTSTRPGDFKVFPEEELIRAGKRLGKQTLKDILDCNLTTGDPDLDFPRANGSRSFDYHKMCDWILLNADQFFAREDAAYFIKRGREEKTVMPVTRIAMDSAAWFIGAAKVDLENAEAYFNAGMDHFSDGPLSYCLNELASARREMIPEKTMDSSLAFLFQSEPQGRTSGKQYSFIYDLWQDKDLNTVKAILFDPNCESKVMPQPLALLLHTANELTGEDLFDEAAFNEIKEEHGLWDFFPIEELVLDEDGLRTDLEPIFQAVKEKLKA